MVEVFHWQRLRAVDPQSPYPSLKRPELGGWWDRAGDLQCGKLGRADCRLFAIRPYVDALLGEVARNPEPYL